MKIAVTCPACQHKHEIEHEPQQSKAARARWQGHEKSKAAPKKKRGRPRKKKAAGEPVTKAVRQSSKPAAIEFACGMCGDNYPTQAEANACIKKHLGKH